MRRQESDSPIRVLIAGGGTGGHVYPAATTALRLRELAAEQGRGGITLTWLGSPGRLEERIAAQHGIDFVPITTGKLRRGRTPLHAITWTNLRDMGRAAVGVGQAWSIVGRLRPDVVVGFGGYVALPVGTAAWLHGRGPVVHEQTVRLGLANRLLARLARKIAVTSDQTIPLLPDRLRARAVLVGNPIRPELFTGEAERAVASLGLQAFDRDLPTVYVTGGALGAAQINSLVTASLPWLLERANVVHQCGDKEYDGQLAQVANLPEALAARYKLLPFIGTELPDLYALIDMVVARSGAGTVAELTALGKPAVLIPMSLSAGGEQAHNARHLAEKGAATMLVGAVSDEDFRAALAPLLTDPAVRKEMGTRAAALGRPEAADTLARLILEAARRDG